MIFSYLNHDKYHANDNLRLWTDEGRTFGRLASRVKDSWDSISFCQESSIDDGKASSDSESLHRTWKNTGFGQKDEGDQETEQYSSQENERQFTTRSLNDGSVKMLDKRMDDKESQENANNRRDNRNYCINWLPSQVLFGKLVTTRLIDVRPPSVQTLLAVELVNHVLLVTARIANPATVISLLDNFDLSKFTRTWADRVWGILFPLIKQNLWSIHRQSIFEPTTNYLVHVCSSTTDSGRRCRSSSIVVGRRRCSVWINGPLVVINVVSTQTVSLGVKANLRANDICLQQKERWGNKRRDGWLLFWFVRQETRVKYTSRLEDTR